MHFDLRPPTRKYKDEVQYAVWLDPFRREPTHYLREFTRNLATLSTHSISRYQGTHACRVGYDLPGLTALGLRHRNILHQRPLYAN